MKTFQGLLGCLLIICYVQYNASAAPSQIHNNHNQETEVDNQEMPLSLEALEEFYEDRKSEQKEGDKDIPTNQADVIYRRQIDHGPLMRIAYTVYSCDYLTLLNSVQDYLDGAEDPPTCTYNLLCNNEMSANLRQRYATSLQTQICSNMVFYDYFIAKIQSSSWATDADAQEWLCYMEDMNLALFYIKWIVHGNRPRCPTYSEQELLTIYKCNRNVFHSPEGKHCVMYSFKHDSAGRSDPDGLNAGHQGCHTAYNIPPDCGN